MRKEFGKVLRRAFAKRMKEVAKEFKEVRISSPYRASGERAFCWSVDNSVCCWIVLSPSPKDYDEFTILIGWSTWGRYPELSVIPSMLKPTENRDEFKQEEYLIRLPQLWTDEDKRATDQRLLKGVE